jgi:hypothetical protein
MGSTLTGGYFDILGQLQLTLDGQGVLQECGVWSSYYALTELRGREDILKLIVKSLNCQM